LYQRGSHGKSLEGGNFPKNSGALIRRNRKTEQKKKKKKFGAQTKIRDSRRTLYDKRITSTGDEKGPLETFEDEDGRVGGTHAQKLLITTSQRKSEPRNTSEQGKVRGAEGGRSNYKKKEPRGLLQQELRKRESSGEGGSQHRKKGPLGSLKGCLANCL